MINGHTWPINNQTKKICSQVMRTWLYYRFVAADNSKLRLDMSISTNEPPLQSDHRHLMKLRGPSRAVCNHMCSAYVAAIHSPRTIMRGPIVGSLMDHSLYVLQV